MPNTGLGRADERFIRAADAFEQPRFYPVYRQWLKVGDRALEDVSSTGLSEALTSGTIDFRTPKRRATVENLQIEAVYEQGTLKLPRD